MPTDATDNFWRSDMSSTNKSAVFMLQIKVTISGQNLRLLALDCPNAHPEDGVCRACRGFGSSLKSSPCLRTEIR